jgi:hypothetical protein
VPVILLSARRLDHTSTVAKSAGFVAALRFGAAFDLMALFAMLFPPRGLIGGCADP